MHKQQQLDNKMSDVEAVKAQMEIIGLKGRHLRCGDTKDWEAYTAMLTEDFVLDISQSARIPVLRGRDAAVRQVRTSCDGKTTIHQAHTPEFELTTAEVLVTWAMNARIVRSPEDPSYTLYGYHYDRWVRSHGEWKLAALRQTTLHLDVHAPLRGPAVSDAGHTCR
jgi:hypothetical protein